METPALAFSSSARDGSQLQTAHGAHLRLQLTLRLQLRLLLLLYERILMRDQGQRKKKYSWRQAKAAVSSIPLPKRCAVAALQLLSMARRVITSSRALR